MCDRPTAYRPHSTCLADGLSAKLAPGRQARGPDKLGLGSRQTLQGLDHLPPPLA